MHASPTQFVPILLKSLLLATAVLDTSGSSSLDLKSTYRSAQGDSSLSDISHGWASSTVDNITLDVDFWNQLRFARPDELTFQREWFEGRSFRGGLASRRRRGSNTVETTIQVVDYPGDGLGYTRCIILLVSFLWWYVP